MLYNVFLPGLQFSPVSIIPPLLYTHPSIYHPHCIKFSPSTVQISPVSIIPPLFHTHLSIYHTRCLMFFSQYISVFPCQYHSTIAPHSSIHLPPMQYNVFLPVLQFYPVSIIPPLLHTDPSIYHPRCIIFFSQGFSFTLSLSLHHCSILINPSTTHAL